MAKIPYKFQSIYQTPWKICAQPLRLILRQIPVLWRLILAVPLAGYSMVLADPEEILVGNFSRQDLTGWEAKKFADETSYSLTLLEGEWVVQAVSRNSASGWIKKIRVDLEKTPFLNWKWRIENRLTGTFDETQKSGDDYAARIYGVVSGGLAIWNTRALNYVWAKNSPRGKIWPNAFAPDNAMMMALRSAQAPLGAWQREKRDLRQDFKQAFGRDIRFIDAIVIMSDTDNTGGKVTAYYGDIYFSRQ